MTTRIRVVGAVCGHVTSLGASRITPATVAQRPVGSRKSRLQRRDRSIEFQKRDDLGLDLDSSAPLAVRGAASGSKGGGVADCDGRGRGCVL